MKTLIKQIKNYFHPKQYWFSSEFTIKRFFSTMIIASVDVQIRVYKRHITGLRIRTRLIK